jgi:hypothetical protein
MSMPDQEKDHEMSATTPQAYLKGGWATVCSTCGRWALWELDHFHAAEKLEVCKSCQKTQAEKEAA